MSSAFAPASLFLSAPMILFPGAYAAPLGPRAPFNSVKRFRFVGLRPSSIQWWEIPVRNGPEIGGKVKSAAFSGHRSESRLDCSAPKSTKTAPPCGGFRASEAISIPPGKARPMLMVGACQTSPLLGLGRSEKRCQHQRRCTSGVK